jgi:hypothetical protein
MARRSRRLWVLVLWASGVIIVAMAAVWAVAPEDVRGVLLLVGGVISAVTIVGGYAIERRVHW